MMEFSFVCGKLRKKERKRTACEFLMKVYLISRTVFCPGGNDLPFGVKMFFFFYENDYESKCHFLSSPHIAIEKPGSSRWGPSVRDPTSNFCVCM